MLSSATTHPSLSTPSARCVSVFVCSCCVIGEGVRVGVLVWLICLRVQAAQTAFTLFLPPPPSPPFPLDGFFFFFFFFLLCVQLNMSAAVGLFNNKLITQHLPPSQFVLLTSAGTFFIQDRRPVDMLRFHFESARHEAVAAFFRPQFPPSSVEGVPEFQLRRREQAYVREASAAALVLACNPQPGQTRLPCWVQRAGNGMGWGGV